MLAQQVQTALRTVFPPACLGCRTQVMSSTGLCPACWEDLPVITGPVCQFCGCPVLAAPDNCDALTCEDCAERPRPWSAGRAALRYADLGRRLVLGLKHSDRHDVVPAAGRWLAQAAAPLVGPDTVLVPVPLHWSRLVKRRYNQSALLAQALAFELDRHAVLDMLQRRKRTRALDGIDADARFARIRGAISVHPKREARLQGAHVLLIDDVMTSGATFTACAEACLNGGAARLDVLALARVCKEA